MSPETVSIRPVEDSDRDWLRETLTQKGHLRIVSRGRLTEDASRLDGFLAERAGTKVGYALVRIENEELEVVALKALTRRQGIGTALIAAAADEAREAGCARAWLITTNDNLDAVRFYQRRGWDLVALEALTRRQGIGTALIAAAADEARDPRDRGLRASEQARARVRASSANLT